MEGCPSQVITRLETQSYYLALKVYIEVEEKEPLQVERPSRRPSWLSQEFPWKCQLSWSLSLATAADTEPATRPALRPRHAGRDTWIPPWRPRCTPR